MIIRLILPPSAPATIITLQGGEGSAVLLQINELSVCVSVCVCVSVSDEEIDRD